MLETDYIRLCQVTLLDKNEKCLTRLQFSEDACTDVATPKDRLLSGKYGEDYTCGMCKEKHLYKDALYAYQEDLFWDRKTYPHGPNTRLEPNGKDEFKIIIGSTDPRFKITGASE